MAAMVDTPASVRLERGGKRATDLGRQECQGRGRCPQGRAKKSPTLVEGVPGRMRAVVRESGKGRGCNDWVRGSS